MEIKNKSKVEIEGSFPTHLMFVGALAADELPEANCPKLLARAILKFVSGIARVMPNISLSSSTTVQVALSSPAPTARDLDDMFKGLTGT